MAAIRTASLTINVTGTNDAPTDTTIDFASLAFPSTLVVPSGESTGPIFGRVFEAGLTFLPGPADTIVAQLGYGAFGTDPTSDANWTWIDAAWSAQVGNDDEYQAAFNAPPAGGQYSYTYRFGFATSGNQPSSWTYADLDGNGMPGSGFSIDQLGLLTVEPVSVAIDDVTIAEGDAGTSIATFTVTRTGGTLPFSVNFATADGTAIAGSDYVGTTSGVLSFAEGQMAQTIQVTVNGDTTFESDETFFVNLSNAPNGVTIADAQGVGTITNDDATSLVAIDDVTIAEGDAGTSIATFTVTRTGGTLPFSVNFATADGTAIAGSDYVGTTSGVLSFAEGQMAQTIQVTVNGDTTFESDETFFVNLSNAPNGVTIADAQGVGTITNDDATSLVAIDDVTIAEGDAGTSIATFTVTRTGGTLPFSVNFATADGTAIAGSDYVGTTSGVLSFAEGQMAQTIQVTVNGDTTFESDETFFVNLSNATDGVTIADAQGVGTITNDDAINDVPDFASLAFPSTLVVPSGESTGPIFGRVFEAGLTFLPGPADTIVAQLGYGAFGTDPTSDANWTWIDAAWSAQVGNDDEYQAAFNAPPAGGQYSYTYRFGFATSGNQPSSWTYADLNGNGMPGSGFSIDQLGLLTVIAGANTAPTVSNVSVTASSISFTANDAESATLNLVSPFATAFGNPTITTGVVTPLTPVEQASAVSGTLQITDGTLSTDVIGLFLGTSAGDTEDRSASATPVALYGFGGDDTITGGAGDDLIAGGSGNDTIRGGDVFAGTGADTLAGGAGFDRIYYDGSDLSIDGGLDFDTLAIFLTPATIDLALADQSLDDTAIVTGFEDVDAFGQSAAVSLSGDGGSNALTGGSGADTIDGRGGQDSLFGNSGNDRITYDGNDFTDQWRQWHGHAGGQWRGDDRSVAV